MPKMGDEAPPTGGGGGGGDFIRHIRLLNDRESCVIRFLTEYGDFFWEKFHRIMEGGSFRGMKVCAKSALGQACSLCDKSDRPGTQFLGWAYEAYHDYTEKPSHVKDEDLEEVRVGKRTMLREEVNEPRLMRYSIMHFDPLKYQWDEEETLVDREFKWVRMGEKGSTRPTYILKPGAPSKLPKELREVAKTLPDLEDVALGKVESLGDNGGEEDEKPRTRKVGKAKKSEPEDDDEDDGVDDPFGGDDDGDDI
jgi:hypothetical protein